ncbi:methionyl-tRNA formyltransferase [Chlamydia sp. 17-3921]|uniref:methionyl-tRNA formyltransferase n=1 Tax=Chlamydia sp. 17-3921 TaxID=2675798 RepID=UPI001917F8C0|nr:methionyl-tRNA formyltransferase [Chlamydia sp. 17-3921]
MNLKVVYFGTPQFAATVLEGLLAYGIQVVGVVSRVDKPQKRSAQPVPSPVKISALTHNLPLLQPIKVSDPEFIQQLKVFNADVFVVVAYGVILRQEILDIPRYGCYNLHAGLLPAYRGAAPIQRCIMDGVVESGNTVIRMDAGMDTGDIVNTTHVVVEDDMTAGELEEALAAQGPEVLKKTLVQLESGKLILTPQDSTKATMAPKLSKEEGRVPWGESAKKVYAHIRGVTPAPGAWTLFSAREKPEKRLTIHKARLFAESGDFGAPGTIFDSGQKELLVACSQGALSLLEIQPEGKNVMNSKIFLNGYSSSKLKIIL